MRINCLIENIEIRNSRIILPEKDSHHLSRVIKVKKQQELTIFNGKGDVGHALVLEVRKNAVEVVIKKISKYPKPDIQIDLIQAIPKLDRWNMILQKATELGVSNIYPLITKHTEYKPHQKRYDRWNQIIKSASEQCEQRWKPVLHQPKNINSILNTFNTYDKLLLGSLYPESIPFKDVMWSNTKKTALIIGPEGDFSFEEVGKMIEAGAMPISFGENILRTETASIFGLSIISYELR